jgi:tRNA A37 threonylcarbamoyladenosine biosynthesis protein TsaE
MGSAAEALRTGIADYVREESGICLIEWAGVVAEALPGRRYEITMEHGASERERDIEIRTPEE